MLIGYDKDKQLQYLDEDVKRMKEFVLQQNFPPGNIQTLVGDHPYSSLIKGFFTNPKITKEDQVLFYYDGHAQPRNLMLDELFSMSLLVQYATYCKAKHVLILLDCCFAGSIFNAQTDLELSRLVPEDIL